MYLETLHKFGACSTILIRSFSDDPDNKDFEYFKKGLTKEIFANGSWNKFKTCIDHVGKNIAIDKFAFFFASTNTNKPYLLEHFKKLGFTPTAPQYNEKNNTTVILWTIPVPELIKTLKTMK